jgi:hypothetical protein
MPINLTTIPKDEQESALSTFWAMLQECESAANGNCDPVLRHWVEQWYEQWNRITGATKKPRWLPAAAASAPGAPTPTR